MLSCRPDVSRPECAAAESDMLIEESIEETVEIIICIGYTSKAGMRQTDSKHQNGAAASVPVWQQGGKR